jgi:hypothetical protein
MHPIETIIQAASIPVGPSPVYIGGMVTKYAIFEERSHPKSSCDETWRSSSCQMQFQRVTTYCSVKKCYGFIGSLLFNW